MATDPGALKKYLRPILGIFAEEGGITPTDVRKLGAALDPLGKKIEIKSCADAGPAFENPSASAIARSRCGGCLEVHG